MYNESEAVEAFFAATIPVLEKVTSEWEIIAIDDGSKDDTFVRLQKQHAKDARVKVLSFSRNFGKEAAMTAGIDHASGKATIMLDADLQDPPSLIPQMVEKWREGYKVVLGQRKSRKGESVFKILPAALFYWLMNKVSLVPIIPNTGDFRLMDREVILAARHLKERARFMRGIMGWSGHETYLLPFDRPVRSIGAPKQTLPKLFALAMDAFISLSNTPLRVPSVIGLVICVLSVCSLFFSVPLVFSLLFFCVGLQFLCLGLLGEYLSRVYRETRNQPLYYVTATLGHVEKAPGNDPAASSPKGF
jgi:glycosyltransferase involved in cell wall biosynthesis